MIDIVILACVLAFAGLCLWLAVKVFIALLPYLVIGLVGWFVWRHRSKIKGWFSQNTIDPK